MESVRDKWKRGLTRIISHNNAKDSVANVSVETEGDVSNMEVEAYYQRLKTKTSLKNLWTGKKFDEMVEDDRTPDISTDSDEQLDLMMNNTMKNIHQLRLDSDEDEMRIDYIRANTIDESNNYNEIPSESDDDEPLNLMNNIHFAEIEIDDVNLSDDAIEEKPKDFLPQLYSTKLKDKDETDSKSFHSYEYKDRSNTPLSESLTVDDISVPVAEEIENTTTNVGKSSIRAQSALDADDISEIPSLQSSRSGNNSRSSRTNSRSSRSHSNRTNNTSSRSHITSSNDSTKTDDTTKTRDSKLSRDSNKSRGSKSDKSRKTNQSKSSSRSSKDHSRSSTASYIKDLSSENTFSETHSRRNSSNGAKKHNSSEKSFVARGEKSRQKHSKRGKKYEKDSDSKDVETQTKDWKNTDKTNDVLNFRYDWQRTETGSLGAPAIDPSVINVLTSYNPSVLAANDLMKFHLHLLRQHIEDSRQLYESYANINLTNNYEYTTVEKTREFIEKNRPKVISYEEALQKVKHKWEYR